MRRTSLVGTMAAAAWLCSACSSEPKTVAVTGEEAAAAKLGIDPSSGLPGPLDFFELPPLDGPTLTREEPPLPSCPQEKASRPEWAAIAAKKAEAAHRPEPVASATPPELPAPRFPANPEVIPLQQRYLAEWRARASELDRLPPEQRDRELAILKRSIIGE